ncbi:hypothetical protein IscW_ISCW022496, partial [Ixodes scapularis]
MRPAGRVFEVYCLSNAEPANVLRPQFKLRIQDIWKEEFTDHFLLRWLRAREFDVTKAEYMLRQNQIWRRENNIDAVLETYQWPQ